MTSQQFLFFQHLSDPVFFFCFSFCFNNYKLLFFQGWEEFVPCLPGINNPAEQVFCLLNRGVRREKVGSVQTFKAVPLLKVDVNVSCLVACDKYFQITDCLEINLCCKWYASVTITCELAITPPECIFCKWALSFLQPENSHCESIFQSISKILSPCL